MRHACLGKGKHCYGSSGLKSQPGHRQTLSQRRQTLGQTARWSLSFSTFLLYGGGVRVVHDDEAVDHRFGKARGVLGVQLLYACIDPI